MKTTLKELQTGTAGINALLVAKLPVKAKYAVSKLARLIQAEMETYSKTRDKLFEDAGCTVAEKDTPRAHWVHDDPEVMEKVKKEADELLDTEVDLVGALPLDLEQFGESEIEGPGFFGLEWAMKQP